MYNLYDFSYFFAFLGLLIGLIIGYQFHNSSNKNRDYITKLLISGLLGGLLCFNISIFIFWCIILCLKHTIL